MQDTELRGQSIEKGQKVSMVHLPAKRDEEAFEACAELRVRRTPHHLAVGFGICRRRLTEQGNDRTHA
jgi:cytochrome P450